MSESESEKEFSAFAHALSLTQDDMQERGSPAHTCGQGAPLHHLAEVCLGLPELDPDD